jgi:hypothetical protein
MFDFLGGSDERGFEHARVGFLFFGNQIVGFGDEAGHGLARIPAGRFVKLEKNALEAFDVRLRFLEVLHEGLLELRQDSGIRQGGKRFNELSFGVVNIPQFLDEKVFERIQFHSSRLLKGTPGARVGNPEKFLGTSSGVPCGARVKRVGYFAAMKTNLESVKRLARDLNREEPRSPDEELGGFRLAARCLDKCRATLAGQQGDYMYGCPMDQKFLSEAGFSADEFKAFVATGASDEEVAQWIQDHAHANV